jgi:hypothetical protein
VSAAVVEVVRDRPGRCPSGGRRAGECSRGREGSSEAGRCPRALHPWCRERDRASRGQGIPPASRAAFATLALLVRTRKREVREAEACARSCRVSIELLPRRTRSQSEVDRGGAEPRASAPSALRLSTTHGGHENDDAEQASAAAPVRLPRSWTARPDVGHRSGDARRCDLPHVPGCSSPGAWRRAPRTRRREPVAGRGRTLAALRGRAGGAATDQHRPRTASACASARAPAVNPRASPSPSLSRHEADGGRPRSDPCHRARRGPKGRGLDLVRHEAHSHECSLYGWLDVRKHRSGIAPRRSTVRLPFHGGHTQAPYG